MLLVKIAADVTGEGIYFLIVSMTTVLKTILDERSLSKGIVLLNNEATNIGLFYNSISKDK